MRIFVWLLISVVIFVLWNSVIDFIRGKNKAGRLFSKQKTFSVDLFYALLILYATIIIGFGLIYFGLSYQGIVLVERGVMREVVGLESMVHSMYFSGVTLLTIGFGDITPIGIGRVIALIEAMIGYLLPTAFVFRLFVAHSREKE